MLLKIPHPVTIYVVMTFAIFSRIHLSIQLKFIQITKLKSTLLSMNMKKRRGDISSFSPVSTGNLGVENIVQIHSFLLPVKNFGISPLFPGLLIALLVKVCRCCLQFIARIIIL